MGKDPRLPLRPRAQFQLKGSCVIHGKALGALSCTCYMMGMGIDRATGGRQAPSGCTIRDLTNDLEGGTTLPQVAKVAKDSFGVTVELHVGSNVASYRSAYAALHAGRAIASQGNTSATRTSDFSSSETAKVNHAALANEGRGWVLDDGVWLPEDILMYDPLADGRRDLDYAPSWWPRSLYEKWCAALRPWGDDDPRVLGTNRIYAGFLPDTEPHVHLKFGGKRSTPFPDRTRAKAPAGRRVNVHDRPSKSAATVVDTLKSGELFEVYQYATGDPWPGAKGSKVWAGDHSGTLWVHTGRLSHVGGTT